MLVTKQMARRSMAVPTILASAVLVAVLSACLKGVAPEEVGPTIQNAVDRDPGDFSLIDTRSGTPTTHGADPVKERSPATSGSVDRASNCILRCTISGQVGDKVTFFAIDRPIKASVVVGRRPKRMHVLVEEIDNAGRPAVRRVDPDSSGVFPSVKGDLLKLTAEFEDVGDCDLEVLALRRPTGAPRHPETQSGR